MAIFQYKRILCILLMVGMVAVTYQVKYDVQKKIMHYHVLQQKVEDMKNQLHLMKIEYSLLTQPERLEYLAKHYQTQLKLRPTEPEQFVDIVQIPFKKNAHTEPTVQSLQEK